MSDLSFNEGSFLVLLASLVFFTGLAWYLLGGAPRWAVVATGVASVILAIVALIALL